MAALPPVGRSVLVADRIPEFKDDKFDKKVIDERALDCAKSFTLEKDFDNANLSIRKDHLSRTKDFRNHILYIQTMFRLAMKGLIGKAVIFGPGLIEPLKDVLGSFRTKIFADYSRQSMDEAISGMNIDKKDKSLQKQVKQIRRLQHDLTGGICDRISKTGIKILNKIGTEGCTASEVVDEVVAVLDSYEVNPKRMEAFKDLQQAQFISSSLVLSQLSWHPYHFINDICESFFGTSIGEDPKFQASFAKFKLKVQEQHLHDLAAMVAPGGRIFFADTYLKTYSDGTPNFVVIPQEITDKLKSMFKVVHEKEWVWNYFPEQGKAYKTYGFVLEKLGSGAIKAGAKEEKKS